MTKDIVDRLRDLLHCFDLPMDELQYGKAWTTIKESADEIARLRTENTNLAVENVRFKTALNAISAEPSVAAEIKKLEKGQP